MMDIEYYQPNEAEQRLIDTLRSGEYKQGHGVLQKRGRLCCLGVACRASRVELDIKIQETDGGVIFNDEEFELPEEVREELAWYDPAGSLTLCDREGGPITLISLNDTDGRTFDQISDVIEAGLVMKA